MAVRWPVSGGWWPVAGGRCPVAGGRWPVGSVRWPVAGVGVRWPVSECPCPVSGSRRPVADRWRVAVAAELRLCNTTTATTTTTTKTTTTSPTTNIVAWARVPWSSNMNIIMVGAWMLWSSDAVKHERYYNLGLGALVIGRSQA